MAQKVNENKKSTWKRPWNLEKFDNLFNRDERFFSILCKGLMAWLSSNILLYDKGITHYIHNTGSSYFYVERNGYNFNMNETTGEDYMYMKMPRCILELGDINVPTEELSAHSVRGTYERLDGDTIKGYNAQMRRLPIEMSMSAKYVLSNFNESIVLVQELIDKVAFQQYFNIVYLGQIIQCSIEMDNSYQIQVNKIDMESPDTNQKNIEIQYKICSNYPSIDERTEIENKYIIESFKNLTYIFNNVNDFTVTDTSSNIVGGVNSGIVVDNYYTRPPSQTNTNSDSIVSGEDILPENDFFNGAVSYSGTPVDEYHQAHIFAYYHDDLYKTTFDELDKYKQ